MNMQIVKTHLPVLAAMFCTASLGQEQNARTPPFSHRSRECTFESYHPLKIGSPIKGGHEELATERPAPLYPAAARRKGIGGRVSIQALIDRGRNVFRVCGYGDSRVLVNAGKHAVLKRIFQKDFGLGLPGTPALRDQYALLRLYFDFKP
jgi:hypothetical protein